MKALWLLTIAGCLFAQTPPPPLTFDVASIKPGGKDCGPASPCRFMLMRQPGGGIRVTNLNLRTLIAFAYDVREFQISGGPAWMSTDMWDINAKADETEPANLSQLTDEQQKTVVERERERLRNLLEDRFQLKTRRESKEQQAYALVVAKGGPKLQESKEGKGSLRAGRGMLSARGMASASFADVLSQQLGRPVIDKTGLTGKYDIDLKWTPDPGQGPQAPAGPPPLGVQLPPPPDPNGPSIFTALTEQLGLRLESEKAPAEVLVIDRVEKPSEN